MARVILLWALVGLLQISNSRVECEKATPQDVETYLCDDIAAIDIYQRIDLLNADIEDQRIKLDALKMDKKQHFNELKEVLDELEDAFDGFRILQIGNCTYPLKKIEGGQGVVSKCDCGSAGKSPAVETTTPRAALPSNCAEALQRTTAPKDGPQLIQIPNSTLPPFYVYCKVDPQQSGAPWTIIQRRSNGIINFYRGWDAYKRGFGNLEGEFFLGLDRIHALTYSALHELWIQLEDFKNNTRWAKYSTFAVEDESNNYALHILGSFSGDAGDSLAYHAGQNFTTYDRDNDSEIKSNCAEDFKGAWWYNTCHGSNLNGLYLKGDYPKEKYAQGINWESWLGHYYSLKYVHMAIRPVAKPAI